MKRLLLVALCASLASGGALAKPLKWMDGPPGLPAGAKFAVLAGDPGKAGPFTVEVRMPARYAVPPHHHPTDEHVRVLAGRLSLGMGDTLDRAKAKALKPGGTITAAANMNHYAFTGAAPAVIRISGKGPFAIVYVNPADDPRKK
ncbi:MAG: cupin domain-containing protein [Alphaproteobacteria bacterium]|nr:cupin domain-containing protein [Alphaproteobacteria bacterium]